MKKKLAQYKKIIPYSRQSINNQDIKSVIKVLKSDFLTQGPEVPKLEKKFSKVVNVKYAVAFNSATSALHAACLSLNIKKNDIVWTSAITFVASANCAIYCNAKIDFLDIDFKTNNISIEKLEQKLIRAKISKKLPKVLIPVHMSGLSCNMKKIYGLSKKYKFKIIEDASHCVGSKYKKKFVGNCQFSDITVFSLHPIKIITSGEGGIAVTKKKNLAENLKLFGAHGIIKDKKKMKKKSRIPLWYYEQIKLGFNYRMTDIQASLALSQLNHLKRFINIRKKIAYRYNKLLQKFPLELPTENQIISSSNHLYIIKIKALNFFKLRNKIFNYLRKKKILVNIHYIPVYFHPFYKNLGFKKGYCPTAEKYYKSAISIPIYPALSVSDQDKVIKCIKNIFSNEYIKV